MKVAIFGTGNMGKLHASIYKGFSDLNTPIIVGRDKDKTEKIAKELNIDWSVNPSEIFNDSSVNAVDICLPSEIHKDYVISALGAGKNVFCEIPIALDLKDAEEMIEEAKKSGKIFQVAQLMRSVSEIETVVNEIKSGKIGKPITGNIYRYHSFTVKDQIIELMTFELDTAHRLFGLPEKVSAKAYYDSTKNLKYVYSVLSYGSQSYLVELATGLPKDLSITHGLRIVGDQGMIESTTVFAHESPIPEVCVMFYGKGKNKVEIETKGYDPYEKECRYFVDTIQEKMDGDLLDANHALNTLKIALAVKKSIKTNQEVTI